MKKSDFKEPEWNFLEYRHYRNYDFIYDYHSEDTPLLISAKKLSSYINKCTYFWEVKQEVKRKVNMHTDRFKSVCSSLNPYKLLLQTVVINKYLNFLVSQIIERIQTETIFHPHIFFNLAKKKAWTK